MRLYILANIIVQVYGYLTVIIVTHRRLLQENITKQRQLIKNSFTELHGTQN